MAVAVAKGTLVADVVAADTVAGVPPCIMGTFLEGKSCKQKYTEEQCSHIHTRQMREGEGAREGGEVSEGFDLTGSLSSLCQL